jgi:hypothetical protein
LKKPIKNQHLSAGPRSEARSQGDPLAAVQASMGDRWPDGWDPLRVLFVATGWVDGWNVWKISNIYELNHGSSDSYGKIWLNHVKSVWWVVRRPYNFLWIKPYGSPPQNGSNSAPQLTMLAAMNALGMVFDACFSKVGGRTCQCCFPKAILPVVLLLIQFTALCHSMDMAKIDQISFSVQRSHQKIHFFIVISSMDKLHDEHRRQMASLNGL